MNRNQNRDKNRNRNRLVLILLFAIFGLPVLASVLLHSRWIDWQPGAGRNHGELVEPVVALPPFPARDGSPGLNDLKGRWQLVHLRQSSCAEDCLQDLYWLRQVRLAQDRHQPEVGLLLISTTPIDAPTRASISELAEDFAVIDGALAADLASHFPGSTEAPQRYIVDPMGNIMMGYTEQADPNGIRRDLGRLLTWTQRDESP